MMAKTTAQWGTLLTNYSQGNIAVFGSGMILKCIHYDMNTSRVRYPINDYFSKTV